MSENKLELYDMIGHMLRDKRIELGYSLDFVSSELGITPKTLQRYELGERKIKIDIIEKLSEIYNFEYDKFINNAQLEFAGIDYTVAAAARESSADRLLQYYKLLNKTGMEELIKRAQELVDLGYTKDKDSL